MNVRASRVAVGLVAWVAMALAAALAVTSERRAAGDRRASGAFDQEAREAADRVAELGAAQQAYLATGQSVAYWMPKVTTTLTSATSAIETLRQTANSPVARTALDEAAGALGQFGEADQQARQYVQGGELLMAGDVIFSEAAQALQEARRQLETARTGERQATDEGQAREHRQLALAAGGAAGLSALIVALLVPTRRRPDDAIQATESGIVAGSEAASTVSSPEAADLMRSQAPVPAPAAPARAGGLDWQRAAQLCTELNRARELDLLNLALAGAAELMEATGLVVWVGSPTGADLRPLLAHGYSPQTLARMATVPRSANNAAAAAYRTSKMQIVLAEPGASGALVAPLITGAGCIGALTAEIRGGSEGSEGVQALATILAAQLAGALAPPGAGERLGAASASVSA